MKVPQDPAAGSETNPERRSEPRFAASGRIRLRSASFQDLALEGVLLDTSSHGFRALHNSPSLASGEVVVFEHSGNSGRARVMWTRIDGGQVQSGFYVLP